MTEKICKRFGLTESEDMTLHILATIGSLLWKKYECAKHLNNPGKYFVELPDTEFCHSDEKEYLKICVTNKLVLKKSNSYTLTQKGLDMYTNLIEKINLHKSKMRKKKQT